jgi:hypothetical protein
MLTPSQLCLNHVAISLAGKVDIDFNSDFFLPTGTRTGTSSIGKNGGKLEFLPMYQLMILTRRIKIIKDKTEVFIKFIPVHELFAVVRHQESL